MLNESRGEMCRRVRDRGGNQSALPNLIEGGEAGVIAHQQRLVILHTLHQHGRSEARVLQSAAANHACNALGRERFRKSFAHDSLRTVQTSLTIPTVETIEIVSANLCV